MAYYRLYFFDGSDRHIRTFRAFEAEDDAAALAMAEQWRGLHGMELWSRMRRVKQWPGFVRGSDFTSPLAAGA